MSESPAQRPRDRPAAAPDETLRVAAQQDFGLIELRSASGVVMQILPSGALFALRHGPTLINQFLPGPAEDGLFRLIACGSDGWCSLVGATAAFTRVSSHAAAWRTNREGIRCEALLELHPVLPAWRWRVRIRNTAAAPQRVRVLHGQDLGLADEAAVRNNEAYVCHYIDLLPVEDERLGWVVFARQNRETAAGKFPWLALACAEGADSYCTDGWQFFGPDHRLTGEPAAVRAESLPSRKLQYEFSVAGLQSRAADLAPGEEHAVTFVARFVEDHPEVSSERDLALVRETMAAVWDLETSAGGDAALDASRAAPLFAVAPWLHGERAGEADWERWVPGERRHLERGADGGVWSFFHGEDTHVVAREKEAVVERPHGHILRSGDGRWIDEGQFGVTCYAAGVFGAQAYLGNPNLGRLLPVVRNALGLHRAAGQRVFARIAGAWHQLGVPTAFALTPGSARWIYRIGGRTIEARVWCAREAAASFLELRVTEGEPVEFLLSHALTLGATEFEHGATLELHHADAWIGCIPHPDTLLAQRMPGACFAIAAADPMDGTTCADARAIGVGRTAPYAVLRSAGAVKCVGVAMTGTTRGIAELGAVVAGARRAFAGGRAARPPAAPFRVRDVAPDSAAARLDEIVPWFTHNASIHFAAPHGLEQASGGAWGVRDVCQGSLEWLLAAGEFPTARRMLEIVFAQQYADDGNWPQWFMHPPFAFIQQRHCHGDVCFWPVKALSDYVEAANDFAFLRQRIRYTDATTFQPAGEAETLLEHCDRVVAVGAARFLPGTALVNYGDGDWDDTLQPADPAMRTRMVSAWTVAFVYHAFRQYGDVCRRAGEAERAARIEDLLARMRRDFAAQLMPDGVTAGFLIAEPGGSRVLLHPRDATTGIRYRLLPMTRGILAELFNADEARHHIDIVRRELLYPDGARLMSGPAQYRGGREQLFKRADSAANVGREIGLQYVHAHLRYAEALAKLGDADGLWRALQVVNPVGLREVLANAAPRQANVYFSSSDAAFPDRVAAAAGWEKLRTGDVAVRGGWRLYSSGPGLFLRIARACMFGVRESFEDVVFDPVLPRALDGVAIETRLCGRTVVVRFRIRDGTHGVRRVAINGTRVQPAATEPNPYRTGGWRVPRGDLEALLRPDGNTIDVEL